ncbi:hypothetical protein SB748_26690 [Rhizobium sp. SIMBA_035]
MPAKIEDHDNSETQDFYQAYKDELTNENNNINQRVIWNIFAQAGLMGAYAGVLAAPKEGKSEMLTAQLDVLVWAIPIMSFLVVLFTLPVVFASLRYMQTVRNDYKKRAGSSPDGRPPLVGRPESGALTLLAEYAPAVIPTVISLAWLVIIVAQVALAAGN